MNRRSPTIRLRAVPFTCSVASSSLLTQSWTWPHISLPPFLAPGSDQVASAAAGQVARAGGRGEAVPAEVPGHDHGGRGGEEEEEGRGRREEGRGGRREEGGRGEVNYTW